MIIITSNDHDFKGDSGIDIINIFYKLITVIELFILKYIFIIIMFKYYL